MKKQQDGNYYEKIVSYKKDPHYGYRFLSIILLVIFILLMKHIAMSEPIDIPQLIEDNLISVADAIFMIVGLVISTIGSCLGAIFLFGYSLGIGKNVKYKRIGK